jgi:chromosome segregation ATPase
MNDMVMTGGAPADLGRLGERIEKAMAVVHQLREDRERLTRERDELARRLHEIEHQLKGENAGGLIEELTTLRREQREWNGERRDVAARIEALIQKLERIEA